MLVKIMFSVLTPEILIRYIWDRPGRGILIDVPGDTHGGTPQSSLGETQD